MRILVAALGLAGHHRGLLDRSHAAGVVKCRLVGHLTQLLVVPIPDRATARVQLMLADAALLGQRPVSVPQFVNAAPLILGQMAEQRVRRHMESVQNVGSNAQKKDGPANGNANSYNSCPNCLLKYAIQRNCCGNVSPGAN